MRFGLNSELLFVRSPSPSDPILLARRLKNAARAVDAPPQKSARPVWWPCCAQPAFARAAIVVASLADIGWRRFWEELERTRAGKLGSRVQSKRQYLGFVEDLLHTGAHTPAWANAYAENGFISSYELIETVARVRKVDAVYSKDFSDLLGVRASIITAGV